MIDPFQDYDQAYADFRWNVPQHLNMAAQVCDVWCERDQINRIIDDNRSWEYTNITPMLICRARRIRWRII